MMTCPIYGKIKFMFVLVDGIGCNPWKTRTKKTCPICRQWGLCGPPGGPLNDLLPSDWSHSVTNPNLRFCTRDAGTGVDSKANARIQENQNIFGGYLETVVSWCIQFHYYNIGMGSFWKLFFHVFPGYQTPTLWMLSLHVTSRSRMFLLYRLALQSLPTNVGKSITRKAFRTLTQTAGPLQCSK